jgi:hypothetical protein
MFGRKRAKKAASTGPETGPAPEIVRKLSPEMKSSVIDAYYRDVVAAPAAARARAQAGFTVASTFVGALVAVGAFARLHALDLRVEILGVVAVSLWLTAAGAFLNAIARPLPPVKPEKVGAEPKKGDATEADTITVTGAENAVSMIIATAQSDVRVLNERQTLAYVAVAFAALLTLATITSALFLPPRTEAVDLFLSPAGRQTLQAVCAVDPPGVLRGQVAPDALKDDPVDVDLDSGFCQPDKPTEVEIPKDDFEFIIVRHR